MVTKFYEVSYTFSWSEASHRVNEKQLEEELTDMQPVFIVVVPYGAFFSLNLWMNEKVS